MKMTADQFATVVRGLPLTTGQAAVAEELLAGPGTRELPRELIRREVLTEYQARLILAGRAADLTVGRYALLEPLGEGGMGQVFKARDTGMDRVVALKLIRDDRLGDAAAVKRFEQEVKAAARLAHPNIVRAYDAGTADSKHFLVTELVAGHDLGRELQRRGAFPAGEACEYARQAAVGLQHAFEQGLTHRDIKPSNLLFSTPEKLVKVADFGLARVSAAGAAGLTADGAVMGTPDYIAPEQASSATQADIRSDLYSLGCTLYQFLTGHVPFPADSALAKLLAHSRAEPDPLEDACPGLNPALIAVVRRLMAKSPGDRFQTPREAAEALIPFCPRPKSSTSVVSPPGGSLSGSQPRPVPPPLPSTLGLGGSTARSAAETDPQVVPIPVPAASQSRPVVLPEPLPPGDDDFAPEPLPRRGARRPRDREPSGRSLWPLYVFLGLLAVGLVVVGAVVLSRGSGGPQNTIQNAQQTNVNVTVPVNVTVKIDDWPKAKEPGVTVYLGDKALTASDLAKPMPLAPGRYTLVAKRDGKELEARAFDVTPESEGQAVATRAAAVPDPVADPGEVRRWFTEAPVTDIVWAPDGKHFVALAGRLQSHNANSAQALSLSPPLTRFAHVALIRFADQHYGLAIAMTDPGSDFSQLFAMPVDGAAVQAAGWRRKDDVEYQVWMGSSDGQRVMWAATGDKNEPKGPIKIGGLQKNELNGRIQDIDQKATYPGTIGCFDPSGPRLLTAEGGQLTLYDETTGKPLAPRYTGAPTAPKQVTMSADGRSIATIAGSKVTVWRTGTAAPAVNWTGPTALNEVAFVPDGTRLIGAGADGTVRIWDAATGKETHQFKHDGPVLALAMSPGGKRVLTGGADKTIRLWQLPP